MQKLCNHDSLNRRDHARRFKFLATLTVNGFSEFQPKSDCTFDYKESRFAPTRGNVHDWRTGQANHRTTNLASKEKRVRINKHRFQAPIGIAKDGKYFC